MATGLGSLVVRLGLDAADFITGATKAEQQLAKMDAAAKRNAASINKQVREYQQQAAMLGMSGREADLYRLKLKGATDQQLRAADAALRSVEAHEEWQRTARAVGVVAGVAALGLVGMVKATIDGADNLNDLSKSTGVAVDVLGGLGFAAQKSGTDLDGVAKSVGKLNLTIAKARAGDKDAAFVFKAVGLDQLIRDGASADKVLTALADKFAEYSDEPETAALANAIFGKSYQSILPLLKEGGTALQASIDKYRQANGVTKDLAEQSDKFNDTLSDIGLNLTGTARKLTAELLPGLQAVADEIERTKDQAGLLDIGIAGIKTVFETLIVLGANVAFVFKGVGREIGALAAQGAVLKQSFDDASLLEKLSPALLLKRLNDARESAQFTAISDAVKADGERARKELEEFERRVLQGVGAANSGAARDGSDSRFFRPRPQTRAPSVPTASTTKDDALKRQLEADLRLIRESGDRQREAVEYAQRYIDQAYDEGTVSLRATIEEQRRLREVGVESTISALDREVEARQAYIRRLPKDAKDGERIQAESQLQDAVARRAAAVTRAAQDSVLANQRDEAAVRRLQQAYADFLSEIQSLRGDSAGAAQSRINRQVEQARQLVAQSGGPQSQVDEYRILLEQTAALSEQQRQANRVRQQAADTEELIQIRAKRAGATEQEVLAQVGVARQKSLAELQALVDKANELARVLGTDEAKDFAASLGLELERAREQADPILNKWLADMQEMGQGIGNSIAGGFEDAVLGARSLREIVGALEQDILRIITRKLVTEPVGNYLSNLFGGNGGSGGGGGLLGSFFSFLGLGGGGGTIPWDLGFAGGGRTPVRGGMFEVAEKRPEMLDMNGRKFLLMGNQRGTIDPMPRLRSGGGAGFSQTNNFTINGPMTRRTEDQISAATTRGAMRSRWRGTA